MGAAADSVIPAELTGWEGLLKAATVRLEPPSGNIGTGFVIADRLVATCAHVVAKDERALPKQVRGRVVALDRDLTLEPVAGSYVRDREGGLDLVLLRIVNTSGTPAPALQPVLTSSKVEIDDGLWTYGHPVRGFLGQTETLRYKGTDRHSDRPGAPWLPHAEGELGEGYSGSAMINLRTGAVCGMVSTSNLKTSVHLVPVAEILARCPPGADRAAVKGDWPWRLSPGQLEAGGWRQPTPLLLDYLKGARKAADGQHPYPMIEGEPPKTLSMVYVSPSVGSEESAEEPGTTENERIPAKDLFGLGEDILLIGAPGSGKSSLLRHAVTEVAAQWKDPDWHDLVPVRVDARDLDKDFPLAAIAEAVKNEILPPSAQGWPPEWFGGPPVPATRWLVLVDGLDEVGGREARKRVIERITALRELSVGDNYRFLVTTRPLPTEELPTDLRRFDLLPLDPRQLSEFATRWLTALKVSDPRDAADRFQHRLEASGMTDPARTPLMASMLCQLFKEDENKPLPRGRSAVYEAFVEATQHGKRWKRRDSPWLKLEHKTAEEHADEGVAALHGLRKMLPGLIERLAYERHNRTVGSAVKLLTAWSAADRPKEISETVWADVSAYALPELLRASGLLRQRRNDFDFIHQTFAEYLTARRIAGNPRLSTREFRRVFGHDPRWPSWALGLARGYDPAATSVVRFLIDAWGQQKKKQRGLQSTLRRLAVRDSGATFIATLVADGSVVDEEARDTAISVLHGAALALDHEAAVALVRMGDERGVKILAETAEHHRSTDHRLNAACGLADLGDRRGIDVLRAMATDSTARNAIPAAEELVRRGEAYGKAILIKIARGPETASAAWFDAARTMLRLQLPEGPEALLARLTDTGASSDARILAAGNLDGRYAETITASLAELIRGGPPPNDSIRALSLLQSPSYRGPRADAVLGGLGQDPGLPVQLRIDAAQAVQNAKRRERLLVAAAADPEASSALKMQALEYVPAVKGRHITDMLLSILNDHSATIEVRRSAAHRLPSSPEPRTGTQAALTDLLNDPDLLQGARSLLLEYTASWWLPVPAGGLPAPDTSPWWSDTVSAMILDGTRDDGERRELITQLSQAGARSQLTLLAETETLSGRLRLLAARRATAITARQGTRSDVRLALARSLSLHPRHRLLAFGEVAWDVSVRIAVRSDDLTRVVADGLTEFARVVVDAVRTAVDWVLTALLRLPFIALLAVLPFAVAVAANAFGTACMAPDPPEDWKLRVYFGVTALLVTTLYLGASRACGMGREGRKVILYGLLAGAGFGLLRLPEPAILNDMGTYLASVIPWDRHWQI
ncbi:trypsin-like peptidase domain-containing protein [Streptomyces sp. NPDC056464]|uniref:trypsin-like peptidase domain-containing protein n=1 Tax=Streptomyces sp. NPDC056464 TaxID=3345828 RepID=UPI0036A4ABB7